MRIRVGVLNTSIRAYVFCAFCAFCGFCAFLWPVFAVISYAQVLGDPPDVSQDFQKLENVYFIGSRIKSFDTATGQGTLQWDRYTRTTTLAFNKMDVGFTRKLTPGDFFDTHAGCPERCALESAFVVIHWSPPGVFKRRWPEVQISI